MLRKLLLPKSYVILTFVITFLLTAALAFNEIVIKDEERLNAVCNFFHINSPFDFSFGYAVTAGIAGCIILIVFGMFVTRDYFSSTSSLGAEGSLFFVAIFYLIKLFCMIFLGVLCLIIFFILSIYTIIFKIVVHEPLD